MVQLLLIASLCAGFRVEEGVVYGVVHRSPASLNMNMKTRIINLVNRVTRKSVATRPMTLATELYWSDSYEAFAANHTLAEMAHPRRCDYGAPGCSQACFRDTRVYYTWGPATPVSNPVPCEAHERCTASAAWAATARVETNSRKLSSNRVRTLLAQSTPLPVAKAARSPADFHLEFAGPNRKRLMFKALLYTLEAHLDCSSRQAASTERVVLSLPVIYPETRESDGVFYLDDA